MLPMESRRFALLNIPRHLERAYTTFEVDPIYGGFEELADRLRERTPVLQRPRQPVERHREPQ